MPIYEYSCGACGHALEAMQKMNDPALTDCPACGKPALKKQISAAGFVLKGGGWYATDFRDKGKKKDDTQKDDTQKDDAKKDSKSAAAGDAPAPAAAGCGSGACDACAD
ncbi:MAG: zinc ribbon domain-containing protein [Gammaproteobacteria bacterium]|nr:zinc ribbon domain-containing protein [Gammaproteobacteria bacterium]